MVMRLGAIVAGFIPLVAFSVTFAQQPATSPLQSVGDMVVGTWTGEGVYAADYPGVGKKGDKFTVTSACRWALDRAAIACEGKNGPSTWNELYFWDATTKQIRSVFVDSGGNFNQGITSRQGDKLVWASAGSLADGRRVEYQGETLFQDNFNTRIEVGATILGGVRSEFRDTYRRVVK